MPALLIPDTPFALMLQCNTKGFNICLRARQAL
jgi:hypothetical protein